MLAKELKQEFQEKDKEFHVEEPRRLFLKTIENCIRKTHDHQAKLFDFRGRLGLLRSSLPTHFLNKFYDEHRNKIGTNINIDIETWNLVYEDGRSYLEAMDKFTGGNIRVDVTKEYFGQTFITSDDMLENRLKILEEEGFVIEEGEEEFRVGVESPIINYFFLYPDCNSTKVKINVFKIKL